MHVIDSPVLPADQFGKLLQSAVNGSDVSDVSSIKEDSGSDLPESHSAFSAPSQTTEKSLSVPDSKSPLGLDVQLAELFAENVVAKIWKVAVREIRRENPPTSYPEYVTTTGLDATKYTMTEANFWTCGFFPGSLYAILERAVKYPQFLPMPKIYRSTIKSHLLELCRTWSNPIRAMDTRTDTHDMGFIIQPALRMDWELTGNIDSLQSVITAAYSLASRYDERVGAVRSWNEAVTHRYSFTDMETEFLVIVDSMCNLDLLYYAGSQTGDQQLIDIATTHAHTVLRALVRDDWSTYHLAIFDPKTGSIKMQLTNQGYRDWSTWSRGQSWAILGFTQTYTWTHDPIFLNAAISLSNHFLSRLSLAASAASHSHPYVPLWDFDAPSTPTSTDPLRDTSAGMIAANGMLLLHQVLVAQRRGEEAASFLDAVLRIVKDTLALSLAAEKSVFTVPVSSGRYPTVTNSSDAEFDAILKNSTANNNEDSFKRYANHGLVYADYYFLELGNKMIRMGLV